MTLSRLCLAMALRSLATRLEARLDPLVSTIVGAVGYATEGHWDVDGLLAVADIVAIQGAKLSGVVAGCGCDADVVDHCYRHLCAPHPCPCRCHVAVLRLEMALCCLAGLRDEVRSIREALAARPKPEADDIDDDDDPLSYGVTAPGGCS